jgi:hypothetical protein
MNRHHYATITEKKPKLSIGDTHVVGRPFELDGIDSNFYKTTNVFESTIMPQTSE